MATALILFCLAIDNQNIPIGDVFDIQIQSDDCPLDLKHAIKAKKANQFSHLDPNQLTLWKLSTPLHIESIEPEKHAFHRIIKGIEFPLPESRQALDGNAVIQLLRPTEELSKYWENSPKDGHLHVVIQVPSVERPEKKQRLESDDDDDDEEHDIEQVLGVAEYLHSTLWNTPFEQILETLDVPELGKRFNYLSKDSVSKLQLKDLGYDEQVLLVRKEYNDAFGVIEEMSLKCRESRIRGVVITGQPGIGKKCFLFYLLLHRLSSGQPTAFQNHFNYFILFKDSGVEMHSRYSSLPDGTWALVDSNEEVVHPCEGFLYRSNSQTTFIVQTTFPRERRWKSWKKHRGAFLYLMDCFPWDEMHALGILLDLSVETLKNHYDKWGPSAGTLIKLTRKPWTLDMHQSRVEEIARNFAEDFNGHILGIDKMGAYHPLVTIHPKGLSPGERGVPIAEIPTEYLNLLVVDAVSTHNLDEQIKFYKLMLRSDWLFKPSVGFMFGKSLVVALLCSYYQTRWKGLGCTPLDTALPSLRIPNCRDWHLFSSNLEGLNQNTPFCLVPKTPGFPTIDVIVCTDSNRIITIQITTSASASAAAAATATNGWNAEGFTEVFNGLPTRFRKDRKWSHVFVTDKAEIAEGMRVEWEGKSVGFTVEEKWIPIEIYFRFLDLVNYRPPGDQGGSMGDEGETSEEGVDSDEEEAGLASEVVHTADLSLPVG